MFLKSVEIFGFKSFMSRTFLEFKPGVTAIVGPNGCGKSNIVDAVLWVLGESNARSLRGEIMEDVIFSGSVERKPLGMAEVSLTIVNDDGLLPVDYSEVLIKRRFYRSGESEFFINKNNVRLRDIHELFADTGIGKPSYSIMEQGKIDLILSNKPEDRIIIFEEAAGITRCRTRMKESYKKLEATQENLLRLNLIIGEVEKEYKTLERQAEIAILYKKLKKEEMELETLYNYERVRALEIQFDRSNNALDGLKKKRDGLEKEFDGLNNLVKRDIEKVQKMENELIEIKKNIYKKEAEIDAFNSKISHMNDRIHEIISEMVKKNNLIEKIKIVREEAEEKLQRLSVERESMHGLIKSQEEKLSNYLNEIEFINQSIFRNTQEISNNTKQMEEVERGVAVLREELKGVVNRLLKEIDSIKMGYITNEKRKNELIQNIIKAIGVIENFLKRQRIKLNDLSYISNKLKTNSFINEFSEEVSMLLQKIADIRRDFEIVIGIQDDLSKTIFSKEGLHSQKESMEKDIENLLLKGNDLKQRNTELNGEIKRDQVKREDFTAIINNLHLDLARNREKESYYEENIKRLQLELEKNEESIKDVEFDINVLKEREGIFRSELEGLALKYENHERDKVSLTDRTREHNILIDRIMQGVQKNEQEVNRKKIGLSETVKSIERVELSNAELKSKIQTLVENFKETYGILLELFKPEENIDMKDLNGRKEKVKGEIRTLGQVNLAAIEDFHGVKNRYNYLVTQREDLERAKEDLNLLISKAVSSSKEIFLKNFKQIDNNFNNIFRRLFNGGKAELYLTKDSDIFNSGIEIIASPPGKSLRRRSLLSGGEKGLTAIAILFSIFMVKPSPFCLLDEVDHDLDEENVMRFIKLLKEFTDTTQFIIVTHNRRTIEFADIIYGVTSEEAGVSKVVSLDLVGQTIE